MATGMACLHSRNDLRSSDPTRMRWCFALVIAILFVVATRWPVARAAPFESDEFGFLEQAAVHWFPMHHTLFMTFARLLGAVSGDLIVASSCSTC